ncbi:MAG: glycosyltransferase [Solirubrobacterales bacterium]
MSEFLHNASDVADGMSPWSFRGGTGRRGPLVSILLPTHNRRWCLPEALASVLQQTYRNLEVFVVRDGGEDVADVVRSFGDPRVIFIDRKENRGKPYSLNEALQRTNGKYVAYLDDDDRYYPHHVETLVEALETRSDAQAAYSDLYKTYYETRSGGERFVLSKQVEISRDFDRFFMMYFNHVLHVSLMHRRDLLDKTGLYNENLNILIDWDMTRRLAFFTDFHHVLTITGEFSSPIGESDRISVQRRKNRQEYQRNVLAIRTTHPPKPWPKIGELAIILILDRLDKQAAQFVGRIWQLTFYPYRLYIPLPPADLSRLSVEMPNVTLVPVRPESSAQERVDAVLRQAEGEYVAIASGGLAIEDAWVENPLYALMNNGDRPEAFLIRGAGFGMQGLVARRTDLLRARKACPDWSVEDSLTACGIEMRLPRSEELPFQFDDLLQQANGAAADGDWLIAARLFELIAERHRNGIWMKGLAARAYFEAGRHAEAGRLSREVNEVRPTVDTLLLEAKLRRRQKDPAGAAGLLCRAEQQLSGQADWLREDQVR